LTEQHQHVVAFKPHKAMTSRVRYAVTSSDHDAETRHFFPSGRFLSRRQQNARRIAPPGRLATGRGFLRQRV